MYIGKLKWTLRPAPVVRLMHVIMFLCKEIVLVYIWFRVARSLVTRAEGEEPRDREKSEARSISAILKG